MTNYPIPNDMDLWQEYIATLSEKCPKRPPQLHDESYPTILDLHGFTLDEGYHVIKTFLAKNFAQDSRMVLIITGNSPNPQSFKAKVKRWLMEKTFEPFVSQIKQAPSNQGGEGALIITLKRNK